MRSKPFLVHFNSLSFKLNICFKNEKTKKAHISVSLSVRAEGFEPSTLRAEI